ncbi:MAG TPA: 4-alpha-glucanotransferase [Acetobacteraceae bacterium]
MSDDDALHALAGRAGIVREWQNFAGDAHLVSDDTLCMVLEALGYPCRSADDIRAGLDRLEPPETIDALPPLLTGTAGRPTRVVLDGDLPRRARLLLESGSGRDLTPHEAHNGIDLPAVAEPGYHRLLIGDREIVLAIAPEGGAKIAGRGWGVAAQVYGLRRSGDGGIGDTASVAAFAEAAARDGADAVALSPMHALFLAQPSRYGPYSPSSRLFLNPLYAAPELVLGPEPVAQAIDRARLQGEFAALERLKLIDWPRATAARVGMLRELFAAFTSGGGIPDGLRADFAQFTADGGALLAQHACFEALQHEQMVQAPDYTDWRRWPTDLRDPDSPAVAAFAAGRRSEIQFHSFLQWLADRSLGAAQQRARDAGMRIGLIADLAVGMDPAGSHAWSRQQEILGGLAIGAPPDLLNPNGQQWGITTFSPQALKQTGFAALLATLRAAMRNCGGARIDHAMGLQRLWLVPEGASAADGAYLRYPLTDMLRLLALESHRHQAVLVGEDLGTVAEGFREKLDAHGVYGMRVLWFERDEDGFAAPEQWDRSAIAMTSTHDLPTVASWWLGADIRLRAQHGVLGPQQRPEALEAERDEDRQAVWAAMHDAGVAEGALPPADETTRFVDAAVRFVGLAACPLALLPLEDLIGTTEQPNLPGTTDQHPNWRRRTERAAAELLEEPAVARRVAALNAERPRR